MIARASSPSNYREAANDAELPFLIRQEGLSLDGGLEDSIHYWPALSLR